MIHSVVLWLFGCLRHPSGRVLWLAVLGWIAIPTNLPAADSFHSARLPHAERSIRVGYWLGVSNNEIFTPATIDFIGQRASIVVLNAEAKGPDPYFDYAAIVARLREKYPGLPVLLYDWAQKVHRTGRVGGSDWERVRAHPEWLLKAKNGKPNARETMALIDITAAGYRQYLTKEVDSALSQTRASGVAFDLYHHRLGTPNRPATLYQNGERLAAAWPAASQQILAGVKHSLGGGRLVLYNGLWPMWPGLLASQAEMLPFADGASVEYFGYYVKEPSTQEQRRSEFDDYVLDILQVMEAHPDKIIPVFGRSRRYVYLHYREDYRAQRYCLASYLLGMTPLATFKYHSHFQSTYATPGRTDGTSYYADMDLDLGEPLGPMTSAAGIYERRFSKALVAVAPAAHGERVLRLDRAWYTPEGDRWEGDCRLPAGTGAILLARPPAAPAPRTVIDDFDDGQPGEWQFPVRDEATGVVEEQGNRFLRVAVAPQAMQPYHERRIQPVRTLAGCPSMTFRIRSTDLSAAVLLRIEVDDRSPPPVIPAEVLRAGQPPYRQDKRRPYAVLVVQPERGSFRFGAMGRDIPYGDLEPRAIAPYFAAATYQANGRWQTITLDIHKTLSQLAPRLVGHRIAEMRLLGNADLDDITLERGDPAHVDTPAAHG